MATEILTTALPHGAQLDFHPAYNARTYGIDYGERYHHDPLFRLAQEQQLAIRQHQRFGQYGMGDADPQPVLGVGVQPLDFMNAALGGRMVFQREESVWTPDRPLEHVDSLDALERLGDIVWEENPLFQDLFRQVDVMRAAYPDRPIAFVQDVYQEGEQGERSFLVMHTPYTTAFRLLGERVMEYMILEEELAQGILEWLMRQYQGLWAAVCARMGWQGTKIHLGDCAATLLSPSLYEQFSLPLYQRIMADCEGGTIHSCGRSTHLLELFAQVPNITLLQLGDGTDLAKARALFPHTLIHAYYDPGQFITQTPAEIEAKLWQMSEALGENYTIFCSGVDPDTPEENVRTYWEVARRLAD
jgi:hypothetical protein